MQASNSISPQRIATHVMSAKVELLTLPSKLQVQPVTLYVLQNVNGAELLRKNAWVAMLDIHIRWRPKHVHLVPLVQLTSAQHQFHSQARPATSSVTQNVRLVKELLQNVLDVLRVISLLLQPTPAPSVQQAKAEQRIS